MQRQKLIPFEQCTAHFDALKRSGKRVVLCHGVFDLLHPGHLKHLAAAKDEGDVLVVSITSAPFVNKGPGRPVFDDQQRAYQLAHLSIVDHVVVRTSERDDKRYKVKLRLRWEDVEKKVVATLNDRQKMKYPMLLGRNFLRDDFLVNVSMDATETTE